MGFEFSIINLIFLAAMYYFVFKIIHSTSLDKPYLIENYRRIFMLGMVFIVWNVLLFARDSYMDSIIREITLQNYRLEERGNLQDAQLGILIIVIAMIYKRGVALQQDSELTV